MYLSAFGSSVARRTLVQVFGRSRRSVHEVPVDHLPPLIGATVTPLGQRRRQRDAIRAHGRRSG